jgi:hypothetical protein
LLLGFGQMSRAAQGASPNVLPFGRSSAAIGVSIEHFQREIDVAVAQRLPSRR